MIDGNDAWLSHSNRLSPEEFPKMGEQAVHRVHEHVLPDQRRHGGHHEERRDHQNADNALPPHRLVQEEGEQDAQHHGDQQDTADNDDQRDLTRWAKKN